MAANKVIVQTPTGAQTIIDLTADTVDPTKVFAGESFHGANGKPEFGTFTIASEIAEQADLIARIQETLAGKVINGAGKPEQEKIIEITENGVFEVLPDSGNTLSGVQISVNVTQPDPLADYQRVEYIDSAEAETYPTIVTDFYADNDSGLEVIAAFPKLQDRIPMGSREDSGATRFYCVYPLSSSSVYYGFSTGNTVSCALKVDTIYRLQTNFLGSRLVNVYDEDGARKASVSIASTLEPHSVPVSIFGYNSASSGAISSKREFKLYSARCSRGHEVVREYIPCYRKSDGAVGLYEKSTGQFLGNQGGGSFVAGPEIPW